MKKDNVSDINNMKYYKLDKSKLEFILTCLEDYDKNHIKKEGNIIPYDYPNWVLEQVIEDIRNRNMRE